MASLAAALLTGPDMLVLARNLRAPGPGADENGGIDDDRHGPTAGHGLRRELGERIGDIVRDTLTLSAAERPGAIEQRVRALQSSVPVA